MLLTGLIFGVMLLQQLSTILVEQRALPSAHLKRYVIIDLYLPKNIADPSSLSLLLINDGQDLEDMPFAPMLDGLLVSGQIQPIMCVGLHCNKYRREEYATPPCLILPAEENVPKLISYLSSKNCFRFYTRSTPLIPSNKNPLPASPWAVCRRWTRPGITPMYFLPLACFPARFGGVCMI